MTGDHGAARTSGIVLEGQDIPVSELIRRARMVEKAGVDSVWLVQLPTIRDSASVLAALAVSTETVQLAAGVLPYYSRPPVVMAQTAATVDELSGGRFRLALGTGHRMIAEWSLGRKPGPPVAEMREYLGAVRDLLHDGEVNAAGDWYRAHALYSSPRRETQPVYLGAFGPKMLRLAGELADGIALWMCTPQYVHDVALPELRAGLRQAGRDPEGFPVTVMVPGMVSDDLETDREVLRKYLSTYARVPNYRRMYEASGFADEVHSSRIGDRLLDGVGVVGDEEQVRAGVARYHDAGADEVVLTPMASAHYDPVLLQRTAEALAG
ncbi:LLM class flavin-dependent oxidoreductase [Streptomyces iconiensis]|uniref:LLM class flavin-dependent oxidoreductase n=1 Tax=Streptomyces iconiensis TaxID=1384038 RepID=A0ABT7A3Y6_9ACTN|nr:LLM class flavin-dependent oxidoreductase [Streptomyces iconiensis]MDJ1136011.1 LLM class flavin-dependent oxidoreductase [Streptomyces iconiensis]